LQFFSQDLRKELGLPHLFSSESEEERIQWKHLHSSADQKVLTCFPQLANPPAHYLKPVTSAPYRLYKLIAPISKSEDAKKDRSIVFIGHIGVGNHFPAVECQSMWATAYLDGKLAIPTWQEQEQEVALFTAWNRRRYLSSGMEGNNMTFELLGYADSLLKALGLSSHRKGFMKDLFMFCKASDFSGLKDEYIRKYGRER
jgi:dimethylaniline monooxygenase (N-oxide forming)